MRYIGFDLGDGESAVAVFEQGSSIEPVVEELDGTQSVISAVGLIGDEIVIGERAYTGVMANELSVRFKSRFTYDPQSYEAITLFAKGVLGQLMRGGALRSDDRFVVGCPAGWNAACRVRYQELLTKSGFQKLRVISESRAAFLYAKYAKTVSLDIDVMRESALVIDIGSSTLDFAYIVDGRETGVGTFGDIHLGGGVLDEQIMLRAIKASPQRDKLTQVFEQSHSWRSFIELEIRRLKEQYYSQEIDDHGAVIKKTLRVCYDGVQKLPVVLDAVSMDSLIDEPLEILDGQSFSQALDAALRMAKTVTRDRPPKLVLLTGGASRMRFFQERCRVAFPGAVVVCCPEPEFSIAKGLAYAGWVDENLRAFRNAVKQEVTDDRVSEVARQALPSLIPGVVRTLSDLVIDEAAVPIVTLWKKGEIDTLEQMNNQLSSRIERVLASTLAEQALEPVIRDWIKGLSVQLQAIIDPICDRYGVPREDMKLSFAQSGSASGLMIDTKELMGINLIGAIVGIVISVLCALLCGGTGVALIATGPVGFLSGLAIGAVVAALGWKPVSDLMMKSKLPRPLRWINVEKKLKAEPAKKHLRDELSKELSKPDSAFGAQVVKGFTDSFQKYLYRIAQSAELPIN